MAATDHRPIVLITGAGGNLGAALAAALAEDYRVVGIDRASRRGAFPTIAADLTSDADLARALKAFRRRFGGQIASVLHLAAYFDFTGEDNPLYETLNVQGTRRLL